MVIENDGRRKACKNNRIREKGKETRLRRQSQSCRVFRVKIDFSHLNEYDDKITTVYGLDKDKQPVIRELENLSD